MLLYGERARAADIDHRRYMPRRTDSCMSRCALISTSQGRGEPVLLLHGLFGAGRHWQDIARRLAPDCRVITVDLRNHGRSPHAERMDYPSMADDLVALLDQLGLQRASVVGHSMGGKVAMALALRSPHRIAKLAVIDIAPIAYPDGHTEIAKAARDLDLRRLATRHDADTCLASQISSPALRAMLLQNLVHDGDGWRWCVGWSGILASLPALCDFPTELRDERSEMPALFVRGGASDYVAAGDVRAILELFPKACIDTLEEAGHWVQADRPAALALRLKSFLTHQGTLHAR
jgi:esterase